MIALTDLWRTYHVGDSDVHALRDVTLEIERGDYLAVMGPSGSGKSTLLNILGCLDRPTSGSYVLDGTRVHVDCAALRRRVCDALYTRDPMLTPPPGADPILGGVHREPT